MLTLWYRILNEYSLRQLSFESDRLDAISGLAERLSRITGDEYIGGMWRSSLVECLQWRPNTQDRGKEAIRQTRHRAPTWSWASCELLPRSEFSRRSKRLLVTNDYATRSKSLTAIRILGVMWQCEGANRFGSLSEASLTIMGRPLRGFAYSGGKAPVFEEEWVTMDEDIEELPALKPSRAEGRQASQTQCFVVDRGETDSAERAEISSDPRYFRSESRGLRSPAASGRELGRWRWRQAVLPGSEGGQPGGIRAHRVGAVSVLLRDQGARKEDDSSLKLMVMVSHRR